MNKSNLLRGIGSLVCGALLAGAVPAWAQQPKAGGTLTIGRPSESETMDPQRSGRLITSHVMYLLYDTLVTLSPDMKTVVLLLASSWDVSKDRTVYTLNLQPNVRFHSGEALTADAVKFTFDRWRDPATKSPTLSYISSVKSVDMVDPLTVRVTLGAPNADFLSDLAIGWAGILNPKSVKEAGADYGTAKVDGTGPYRFVEWRRSQALRFTRNDAYRWGPGFYKNRGPAHVQNIVWRMIPEDASRVLELETGGINVLYPVPLQEADRLKSSRKAAIVDYAFGFTIPMFFNLDQPAMSDVRVRRAIAHAINREELAKTVYHGYAQAANGPISSGFPEYWSGISQVEYPFDQKKAEALLDEAGWRKGPSGMRMKDGKPLQITQYLGAGYGFQELFTIVQARLRQVGIQMDLKIHEWATVYGHMRKGEHDVGTRWMIYSSPQNMFQQFYQSSSAPLPNSSMYKNPEVDKLIDRLLRTDVAAERRATVEQLLRIVMRDLPTLPLTWQKEVVGFSPSVKGFQPVPMHGAGFYKLLDTWVE